MWRYRVTKKAKQTRAVMLCCQSKCGLEMNVFCVLRLVPASVLDLPKALREAVWAARSLARSLMGLSAVAGNSWVRLSQLFRPRLCPATWRTRYYIKAIRRWAGAHPTCGMRAGALGAWAHDFGPDACDCVYLRAVLRWNGAQENGVFINPLVNCYRLSVREFDCKIVPVSPS